MSTRISVDLLDAPEVMYNDGHFVRASTAALYSYDLSAQAFRLLVIIEHHAGQNRKANPTQKRLSELMNVSVATLKTYVKELRDQGWLQTEGDQGDTCSYTISIPSVYKSLAETYQGSQATVEVFPKKLKKHRNTLTARGKDMAIRLALSVNNLMASTGGSQDSSEGVASIPATPSQDSSEGVASIPATNDMKELDERTDTNKLPLLRSEDQEETDSNLPRENQEVPLVETNIPGQDYKEILVVEEVPLVETLDEVDLSSGYPLVDEVEANASPSISPSGDEDDVPDYSSVTSGSENVNEVDLETKKTSGPSEEFKARMIRQAQEREKARIEGNKTKKSQTTGQQYLRYTNPLEEERRAMFNEMRREFDR